MSNNINKRYGKTFKALVELGLNLETGKSKPIKVTDIEQKSGVRQNSNGMRIIRSDQKPFDCFKISRYYNEGNGSLEYVEFNGYRDVAYELQQEKNAIADKKDKIDNLEELVVKHVAYAVTLKKRKEAEIIYSKADILPFI